MVEVSPTLITNITDSIKEDKKVVNKAMHMALGVNIDSQKELLGVWITNQKVLSFGWR